MDKAIRAAKLTAAGILDKARARTAVDRAGGQIAPSKYLPGVPRQVHAAGGPVAPQGYSLKVDPDRLGVLARFKGKNVGQLTLSRDRETGKLSAFQMAVHPDHQRKGLMSAMHDAAEQAFGPMEPDKTLTDDGFAFWKGYRPDAVSNNLRFHTEKLIGQTVKTPYGPGTVKSVGSTGMNAELENGNTGWARASDNEDVLRGLGIDPSTIKYAAGGKIAPSKYMPGVPRQVHADGGKVAFQSGNHPEVPDVLYHGTKSDFRSFQPLSHFGTQKAAHERLNIGNNWSRPAAEGEPANVVPVHISMKNPLDLGVEAHPDIRGENWLDDADMLWQVHRTLKSEGHHQAADKIEAAANDAMDNDGLTDETRAAAANAIRSAGYDGLMYTNKVEDRGSRSFVALGPEQVKSTISARKFDPTNPDMTFASGGYVPQANIGYKALPVAQAPSIGGGTSLGDIAQMASMMGGDKEAAQEAPQEAPQEAAPQTGVSTSAQAALDALRSGWKGQSFDVISGYRDPQQNEAAGGAKGSQHLHGNAFDVDTSGWTPDQKLALATQAYNSGFRGFGFYDNNLHFDVGGQRAWGPSYHSDSVPEWAQPFVQQYVARADGGKVENFKNWFGNSVTHTDGEPHVLYTGTSKDKDFTSFNVGRHGAWFTKDPSVASSYAESNDSQGYKVDGWKTTKTNTASRVIPAYVKAENPYTGDYDGEIRGNYKSAQSDWFDKLRAKGHDAWIPSSQGGNLVVALKEPQQIKSIYNKGSFDPKQKHMGKAEGGEVDSNNQGGNQYGQTTNGNRQIGTEAQGFPVSGGLRGGQGILPAPAQASGEKDLIGLPTSVKVPKLGQTITAGHDPRIRSVARDYAQSAGLDYNPPTVYQKVDPARAKRIAAAYDAMPHDPDHPLVKASYGALLNETLGQYQAMKRAGMKLEFYPDVNNDPYKSNPRLAVEDVKHNNHMYVYPTDAGFGSGPELSGSEKNPMLGDSGERWNGKPVMFNDLFRAVHDYFGHAKEGVGFRADGEENAWRSHAAMFSPLARIALGTETRGQNSWLNYGPHGEKNRTAATEDTVFADQKLGVLPHWVHHEGAEDFIRPHERQQMEAIYRAHRKSVGGALDITRRFTKGGAAVIMSLKSKGN